MCLILLERSSGTAAVPTPLFLIDRCTLPTRVALVAAVKFHTSIGTIVRVEDSGRPRGDRLCYEVRSSEGGYRLRDAAGRHLGLFATLSALVEYAEVKTTG